MSPSSADSRSSPALLWSKPRSRRSSRSVLCALFPTSPLTFRRTGYISVAYPVFFSNCSLCPPRADWRSPFPRPPKFSPPLPTFSSVFTPTLNTATTTSTAFPLRIRHLTFASAAGAVTSASSHKDPATLSSTRLRTEKESGSSRRRTSTTVEERTTLIRLKRRPVKRLTSPRRRSVKQLRPGTTAVLLAKSLRFILRPFRRPPRPLRGTFLPLDLAPPPSSTQ